MDVAFERASARYRVVPAAWSSELFRSCLREPRSVTTESVIEWYRWHSKFYSERLQMVDQWQAVPALEKHEMMRLKPAPQSRWLYSATTSGTSGTKVTVFYSREEFRFKWALMYRPFAFYSLPAVVRQVIFLDTSLEQRGGDRLSYRTNEHEYRSVVVPAHWPVWRQFEFLKVYRPHVLRGFPSAIYRLCVEAEMKPLRDLDIKVVSPSGEWMEAAWRETIQDALSAPVYDRYGATETGAIAWECPMCSRYHYNSDEHIVETDEEGYLLITPLFLAYQPLLRYRLGDCVAVEPEDGRCRVSLPTLQIKGARRDDWLRDGLGRLISPLAFQFEHFEWISQWHVHQNDDKSLVISFKDLRVPRKEELEELRRHVVEIVPCVNISIRREAIKPNLGKFKRVTSDLSYSGTSEGTGSNKSECS